MSTGAHNLRFIGAVDRIGLLTVRTRLGKDTFCAFIDFERLMIQSTGLSFKADLLILTSLGNHLLQVGL